jgi:hypothetical protein
MKKQMFSHAEIVLCVPAFLRVEAQLIPGNNTPRLKISNNKNIVVFISLLAGVVVFFFVCL